MTDPAAWHDSPWIRRLPTMLLALVLAAALARWGWLAARAIGFPYPLDYGEGPLLDQVARIVHDQPLYRADLSTPPYTVANYPPLYPAALAAFYRAFGPAYWYGRVLSWISTLVAAVLLGAIVHRATRNRPAATVAGAVFLAIPYVAYWSVLFRIDALALAVSLGGLWLLVRGAGTGRSVLAPAVLFVAAVFVRQSYGVAAPLAAFAWLLARGRRRDAGLLAGTCVALGGLGLLGLEVGTRGGFTHNIITANVNAYSLARLGEQVRDLVGLSPFLLGVALLALWKGPRGERDEKVLLAAYFAGAVLSGATIGKIGSNVNYFMELSAALGGLTGILYAGTRRGVSRWGLFAVLAAQILLFAPRTEEYFARSETRIAHRDALDGLMASVHEADGVVLADSDLGLLPLDGRSVYFQPFEMTQLAARGLWDPEPLAREVLEQHFPLVLMFAPEDKELLRERWPVPVLKALSASYAPAGRVGATVLFLPRGEGASQRIRSHDKFN